LKSLAIFGFEKALIDIEGYTPTGLFAAQILTSPPNTTSLVVCKSQHILREMKYYGC
jgi:hypothetical protein